LRKKIIIYFLIFQFLIPDSLLAKEEESKARRFEILFNISLPFNLILSYLLISTIETAFDEGRLFSVKEEHRPLVFVTALVFSFLVAFKGIKEKEVKEEKKGSVSLSELGCLTRRG
jgi:hypothetical protein